MFMRTPRSFVGHGTTIATNAILESAGAKSALLTNRGFKHVVEIGRQDVPRAENIYAYVKPRPPVPASRVFEIGSEPRGDVGEQVPLPTHDQRTRSAAARPRGKTRLDHARGEVVQLRAALFDLLADLVAHLAKGAAGETRLEVVRRLLQRARPHVAGDLGDAVLDQACLGHQDDQSAARGESDEFDVLDVRVTLRRHHDAGAARQARQQRGRLLQRLGDAAADRGAARLDALALLRRQVADLEQAVDEQPHAGVGRQAAGRGVRGVEQAEILQVGEFKGAGEPLTRTSMSPQLRAQYESFVGDLFEQLVERVSADRKLAPEKVRELIDVGVFTPEAAWIAARFWDV